MKQVTLITLLFILNACTKSDNTTLDNQLTGKWVEFENFISTGPLGSWKPASNITVDLNANFSYTTNNDNYFWGRAGSIEKITDSTFVLKSTVFSNGGNCKFKITNDTLEIWYPCIEGCASKFKRKLN